MRVKCEKCNGVAAIAGLCVKCFVDRNKKKKGKVRA